jgi:hypothetical protein
MMANKVGSLKRQANQVDDSGLEITFHEVKFVPNLWINFLLFKKS